MRYPIFARHSTPVRVMGMVLLVVLVFLLLCVYPRWGHSREWGYGPFGGVGLIIAIVLLLVLFGLFPYTQ